jgi:endonuclease YncB( thermonuclease family)
MKMNCAIARHGPWLAPRHLRALALVGLLTVASPAWSSAIEGRVVRVVDGDTLTLLDGSASSIKVRLASIDAPECAMPDGPQAQLFLAQLVLGKMVQGTTRSHDRYGRVVASLRLDGEDVGLLMIRKGLAWHDRRFTSPDGTAANVRYAEAQRKARLGGAGLWRLPAASPPWAWRAQHSGRHQPVSGCGRNTRKQADEVPNEN